jgi:uncharacterized repeat protein (TIGR01451 family)
MVTNTGASNDSATDANFATVAEADVLTAQPIQPVSATEAAPTGSVTATFNDTYTANTAADFTASIDWNDGSAVDTNVSISDTGGIITVTSAGHTYAEEGTYNPTVTLNDDDAGTATATATLTVNVAEVPVTVSASSGATTTAIDEGSATPANTIMGTFADPGNSTGTLDRGQTAAAPEYAAVIDWGDGTTSTVTSFGAGAGIVYSGAGGVFDMVAPAHTYAEESTDNAGGPGNSGGVYNVTVSVTHNALAATAPVTTDTVTVNDPSVRLDTTPLAFNATENEPSGVQPVATFTDPGGPESLSEYSATIDWGDGTPTSTGTITLAGGVFTVSGAHTYAEESDPYPITVTVNHGTAAPASAVTAGATVSDPPVLAQAAAGPFTVAQGQASAVQTLATFIDPAGPEARGDYSVDVNWADGRGFVLADPNVTISGPDSQGVFTVSGSHTYVNAAGVGTILVRINHEASAPSPVVALPTAVSGLSDVRVSISVSNPTPTVGDTITYTVTLSNFGPAPATGVTVLDLLPNGLTFVSATASGGGFDRATGDWTVGTVPVGTPITLTISATVTGTNPRTDTATITHTDQFDPDTLHKSASVVVTPQPAGLDAGITSAFAAPGAGGFTPGGVLSVIKTGTGGVAVDPIAGLLSVPDPQLNTALIIPSHLFDPGNGDDRSADLVMHVGVDDRTPNVGDTITYTITLTNAGPDPATKVTVQQLLPEGVTFMKASANQGSYDAESGVWTVGTVDTSSPLTLTITATVNCTSPVAITASITNTDVFDPDPSNNGVTLMIRPRAPELALSGTVDDPDPSVDDVFLYPLTLNEYRLSDTIEGVVSDLPGRDTP